MTQNDHANTEASRKLAQSNSKSEDTPDPSKVDELTDKLRKLLNKDGVWSSEYNSVLLEIEESATPEPPQDTCDCLCHNPDALKWGCEHCAMPPQYTTILDVVNGTPKGQEAVQKAIDDSIKVQNEMTKKAQDTSLDDILAILDDHHSIVTDELGKSCAKELLAWHKAEIAKLFEQIRSEVIGDGSKDSVHNYNDHQAREVFRIEQLEALTRLEGKDE